MNSVSRPFSVPFVRGAAVASSWPVAGAALHRAGGVVLRYGLVLILLYFGSFKFTVEEAHGVKPLLAHSPFFSWLYALTDVRGASNLIGTVEIALAVLIALRPWFPLLSALGGAGAIGMFLSTLSFLFTTPGVWGHVPDFPLPVTTADGAFLSKDIFLLGAATWATGEALLAAWATRRGPTAPEPVR